MSVSSIGGPTPSIPEPSREQMIAVAAARPAALQLQAVALAAQNRGSTGQGTPSVNSAGLDLMV